MAVTTFKYRAFNETEAKDGTLCLMIADTYQSPEEQDGQTELTWQTIATNQLKKEEGNWVLTSTPNDKLKGSGVCRVERNGLVFTSDTIPYVFSDAGLPISDNASGWKLYLAKIMIAPQAVGNAIDVSYKSSTTRSAAGIVTSYDFGTGSTVMVDQLNARDAFAMQALQGIMEHIDRPDAVSDNEINFYTTMAYKWAANMMMAAAQARSELKDKEEEGGETPEVKDTEAVTVGALEGNTEKLLNNIVAALEKTDEKDGDIYSERVSIPKLIKFLENYISHTEEPEEGSEEEPVTTKYGLYDLIQAIKDISSGGGEEFTGDVKVKEMPSQTISSLPTLSGSINLGNTGLGRDADHPIYMSGGGFPSRQVLASAFAEAAIHDFLTFNAAGAVGYSTKDEVKKAILGYLNSYTTLSALSTAVLGELTADAIYNKIQSKVDDRIKAWLQAARDAEGRPLTVNTPS